jgi:hypothetical protein
MLKTLVIEEWNGTEWIPEERTFDLSQLSINEEKLSEEACAIGQSMVQYGEAYALLKSQLARKEEIVKRVAAQQALGYRKVGIKPNDAVKESVLIDATYIAAFNDCNTTRIHAMLAEAWWRTLLQKCDLIKMLGYKINTELKREGYGG